MMGRLLISEAVEARIIIEDVELVEPWIDEAEREIRAFISQIASIQNGEITAYINAEGWLTFKNSHGKILTEEYWRDRNRIDRYCVPLRIEAREMKPLTGTSDYALTLRFEAYEDEKIFGLGQYQEKVLNKRVPLWNWPTAIVRPACHLYFQAAAMAFYGTILP